MRAVMRLLRNLAIIGGFLLFVGLAGFATWVFMPDASRQLLREPGSVGRTLEQNARRGPVNPFIAFRDWILEQLAELRDMNDVVVAADGTNAGITPLPAWTQTGTEGRDTGRFFGATESIWQSRRARLAGVRWSRVVFFWSEIQPRSARDWRAGFVLPDRMVKRERDNGVEVIGLLINTPAWAQADSRSSVLSVPAGLDRPIDDPQNYWASFVRLMAADYRGRIDTWIVWNEPDIPSEGPNSQYHTWAGDAVDYARLLRVAYLAAKQGNPNARIVFGATTYWSDVNAGRPLFLERSLTVLAGDPDAARSHFYLDAVALNLYTSADDLGRVAGVYRDVLGRFGLDAPLWLTETNATPYDDPAKGLRREQNGLRVTLEQQSAYVIQAFALGLASGLERMAFHSTMDRATEDEVWGLVRNDGTLRPAFVAYQTAARYLSGGRARFVGRERPEWRWPPGGYVPNWQVYLVGLEREAGAGAGSELVSVLWNGDGAPLRVSVPARAAQAELVDKYGRAQPQALARDGDRWVLTLPPATAHSPLDPDGYFFVGGDPLLLVERGVTNGLASLEAPSPVG
ncbi:MAG TPA: hypothetical protein VFX49_15250 [Chloroflexota bacterium]|nr:hypothetical protein [Chloroflexota bacterium]